jgi:N6-adenosine-specific RNA methylase IME4
MFSRGVRAGWATWGDQAHSGYEPTWETYSHNSASDRAALLRAAE